MKLTELEMGHAIPSIITHNVKKTAGIAQGVTYGTKKENRENESIYS
jgi:hypothetical protein